MFFEVQNVSLSSTGFQEAGSFQKNYPIELVLVISNSCLWSREIEENPAVNDFVKPSKFKNRGTICFIGGGVQEDNKETPNGQRPPFPTAKIRDRAARQLKEKIAFFGLKFAASI